MKSSQTVAKKTIEKISRGQFMLHIIQHGEGGKNREIQVVDVVEGYMVKGVTEQAVIASILLDMRTAAKHFGSAKAQEELAKEEGRRVSGKPQGLQKILPQVKVKPRKPWPKLRPAKSTAQIQRECEEAEKLEAEKLEAGDVAEAVVKEAEEAILPSIEPDDLAAMWDFETEDTKGLFIAVATAYGSESVDSYLESREVTGVLDDDFVAGMAEELGNQHDIEKATASAEVVEEKKKARSRKKPKDPKVFEPGK